MLRLPIDHPLVGMLRRRERAVADQNLLDERIRTFRDAHLGHYLTEPYPGGRTLIRASIKEQPDPDWGIDLGEIIYNIRCCLDYLVYQLAVEHHRKDPPPNDREIQFPIYSPGRSFPYQKVGSWVGKDVADWLQSIQPQPGTDWRELETLATLSNRDKHRRLAVVAAGIVGSAFRIVQADDVLIDEITEPSRGVVVDQQVVGSFRVVQTGPNPQYRVEGDFGQDVVFGEGGPFARKPVLDVIYPIFPVVERVISEGWVKFFGVYRKRWDFAVEMAAVPTITITGGCGHWSFEDVSSLGVTLVHNGHPDHEGYQMPKVEAEASP